MKQIKILSLMLLLFCCSNLWAQDVTVKGTVSDEKTSEPLMGVSVLVKGTTKGTITDMDGNYSLSVPQNSTLAFSLLGYLSKETKTGSQTTINITLKEDSKLLDEVVVVGTVMKKSDLTGAVGSINAEKLVERPVTSINEALQGRIAGVLISSPTKPGDDATIRIRGINTIDNNATKPIYVVDGLVMDDFGGGFNSINLNDVESIEVMKDASSTALYGSRGANGVVVITTKKGKKGEGKVSYDGWVGVRSYANMPKTMDSKQLFELRRDAAINGFNAKYPNATASELDQFIQNRIMTPYNPNGGGGGFVFGQYELDAYANPNFQDADWLDAVTQDGIEQSHALNFTGGSDKGTFFLSFGYSNQKGLIKKIDEEKFTGRINADYNIKPWLKVGTNTSYIYADAGIQENDGVFDKARGANPMLPVTDDILTLNYGDFYDQNYFNPLNTQKTDYDRIRNRIISSNFLNINPMKGLNIRTSFSLNHMEESRLRYVPNNIQEAIRYAHHGEARHTRDFLTTWQWDNSISYDNTFGKHRVNGMIGTSMTNTDRNYTEVTARGFNDNVLGYRNLAAANHVDNISVGSEFMGNSLMSYFARGTYTYNDKYSLTATARYDGSSKFTANNRWGFFPSFSAAWDISQEDFMQENELFNQLKLRAGYGKVGNQEIDNYAYLTLYTPNVTKGETTYLRPERMGNSDIAWESQDQFNIGMDVSILNNRVRLNADYFHTTNTDLLMRREWYLSSGHKELIQNIGEMENQGLEFSLTVNAIKTKDFEWNISANISGDRNKITKLAGDVDHIYKYDGDRNMQKEDNLFVGQSRNTIFIWKTGGIANAGDMGYLSTVNWAGRQVNPGDLYPTDISGPDGVPDGKIDDIYDRILINKDPKFYGGFATDFTYKGISLNAVFSYSYGGKKLSPYYETLIGSTGKGIASIDLSDRWTPENTDAKFPRPIMNDPTDSKSYNVFSASNMDHSIQDASYLRLSALTLAYTLPRSITNKLKVDNLRLYTTGSNLFCITPYKGYDPEIGDWYPPTRMFVFGMNLSF